MSVNQLAVINKRHMDCITLPCSSVLHSESKLTVLQSAGAEAGAGAREQDRVKQRQGLILVASLVDEISNLAGLTRTCEVFRAATMVVSDKRVIKDPAFASISVTADQWLPLIEVAEPNLVQWMLQKRAEGFTLVGVEQTAESVLLPDYAFPGDCVLLLGREREGIPMHMLQLLDHTVEIPQLGLVRSLNVHVSGAITLYEYSKQQLTQACSRAGFQTGVIPYTAKRRRCTALFQDIRLALVEHCPGLHRPKVQLKPEQRGLQECLAAQCASC